MNADKTFPNIFLHDSKLGQIGPLSEIEILEKLGANDITYETLAFTMGMSEWKSLNDSFWEGLGFSFSKTEAQKTENFISHDRSKLPDELKTKQLKPVYENNKSIDSEQKKIYQLKVELGWWETVLHEIRQQDLLEDLEDINFLEAQINEIRSLTVDLRKKGIINSNAIDFITSEYKNFDKEAENIELSISNIWDQLTDNNFLGNFINNEVSFTNEWEQSYLNQIHTLCKKFINKNSHRIIGHSGIGIWELFGDKYGKAEDLPLIRDIIYLGNKVSIDKTHLKKTASPVLKKIQKIIELLLDLTGNDGKIVKDNYIKLKYLQKLCPTKSIEVFIEEKEQLLTSIRVNENLDNLYKNWKLGTTADAEMYGTINNKLSRLKECKNITNYNELIEDKAFKLVFGNDLDFSLTYLNKSLEELKEKIQLQKNDLNSRVRKIDRNINSLNDKINGLKNPDYSGNMSIIGISIIWVVFNYIIFNNI